MKEGASQTVSVEVTPAQNAAAGDYPILVRIGSGDVKSDVRLMVTLSGTYKLDAGTPNGILSLDAVGGKPLVLHGGTGIPEDMVKKAISLGVAKVNVNTECQLAFQAATRAYIEAGKDQTGKGFDPRKLLAPGFDAICAKVLEKMELFGSVGKA